MKKLIASLLLLTATMTCYGESSRLAFVTEYIRELGEQADIERAFAAESKLANKDDALQMMMNNIRSSSRYVLEFNTDVGMLDQVKLDPPFETLAPNMIIIYKKKLDIHRELKEIANAFVSSNAPAPGVDYGKLAARASELTADMEHIGKVQFDMTPLVFALLIDDKADKAGHVSHLRITRAERRNLIRSIKNKFGASLEQRNQSFTVSSATVLLAYFLKDFKCSDDPW